MLLLTFRLVWYVLKEFTIYLSNLPVISKTSSNTFLFLAEYHLAKE